MLCGRSQPNSVKAPSKRIRAKLYAPGNMERRGRRRSVRRWRDVGWRCENRWRAESGENDEWGLLVNARCPPSLSLQNVRPFFLSSSSIWSGRCWSESYHGGTSKKPGVGSTDTGPGPRAVLHPFDATSGTFLARRKTVRVPPCYWRGDLVIRHVTSPLARHRTIAWCRRTASQVVRNHGAPPAFVDGQILDVHAGDGGLV